MILSTKSCICGCECVYECVCERESVSECVSMESTNRAYGPIIDCLTVSQLLKMRKRQTAAGDASFSCSPPFPAPPPTHNPLSLTCLNCRPLCTDEIFNLARAAPNVCVLNLHGNLSILTENGQCKCLPGQMNGQERRDSGNNCCCCCC